MRHDWIFDVLADLRTYADANNLPVLAEQVSVLQKVAELEIGAAPGPVSSGLEDRLFDLAEKRRRAH
ncbi:hypothetical protein EGN72_10580 [Pseudorhodobacter sp. E13]|uniref:hypothetical protein n=1 Tax=Pseudorhodobacter sp. E13 TaxID=2487931 RepID=UPI000F8D8BE4|nr:hypothetical protein [Pseudorhodobacter sp. E13]RUS60230.1 hypothetical protein EGN72_10580 [Pseudorhodobacter sp. E13]